MVGCAGEREEGGFVGREDAVVEAGFVDAAFPCLESVAATAADAGGVGSVDRARGGGGAGDGDGCAVDIDGGVVGGGGLVVGDGDVEPLVGRHRVASDIPDALGGVRAAELEVFLGVRQTQRAADVGGLAEGEEVAEVAAVAGGNGGVDPGGEGHRGRLGEGGVGGELGIGSTAAVGIALDAGAEGDGAVEGEVFGVARAIGGVGAGSFVKPPVTLQARGEGGGGFNVNDDVF